MKSIFNSSVKQFDQLTCNRYRKNPRYIIWEYRIGDSAFVANEQNQESLIVTRIIIQ